MSVRRILAGVASAAILLLASPGTAFAEPTSTIEQIAVQDGDLTHRRRPQRTS